MTDKKPSPEANKSSSVSNTDTDEKVNGTENTEKQTDSDLEPQSAQTSESLEASIQPTASSHKPSGEVQHNKKAKTGLLWFVALLNLILVLLLCAAAFWYYTKVATQDSDVQSAVVSLEQQLAIQANDTKKSTSNIQAQQQSLSETIESYDIENKQALTDLQNKVLKNTEDNNAFAKQLAEMSGRRPSDWLLAEANYLVNMAGRKLYLEKDVKTAMTLLKEADARLEDLNDPSLFPVRALIAGDIQALSLVNPVSTNSIALAIAGMLPKVSDLPLDTLQLPEDEAEKDYTLSEDVSDWRQNLSLVWESLVGDLFTIDYVDEPLAPYLAQRQQWLIEQQLKHSLTQAQTAALNEQVELYRSSMQQAITLIVEHYQLDDTSLSSFLVALQELQNIDFSRNYPDKLSSQASLKDLLERRVQSLFNNNAPSPSDSLSNSGSNQS